MQIRWSKLHCLYCYPHLFILLQETVSELSSQDNGIVAVENVNSSDIPDNASLSTDLYVHDHIVCCFIITLFLCATHLAFSCIREPGAKMQRLHPL